MRPIQTRAQINDMLIHAFAVLIPLKSGPLASLPKKGISNQYTDSYIVTMKTLNDTSTRIPMNAIVK